MPASFVWQRLIEPQLHLQQTGVSVLAVDGRVWAGQAHIRYQQLEFIADWDILLSGLMTAAIPIDLTVQSHAGFAELSARLGLSESRIELKSADIDLQPLTPLFKRQRIELSGQMRVKDLVFDIVEQRVRSADGGFSWSGGEIAYPAAGSVHKREMPAFLGKIDSTGDGVIRMGIRDNQADFDLIEGTLQQDGTALITVKRRLLDLADEVWPRNSSEQDVVFKVKKVIY